VLLEVCVDSVASALAAQRAGAARVELCCALASGGETPSLGLARVVLARLAAAAAPAAPVPVHALVRPRAGDFCYSADEAEVMLADVAALRRLGVAGVVIGALDADGAVDAPLMRRLIEAARGGGDDGAPLSVTFHRAIDAARDPLEALRACLALRVDRVLSSGQAATAPQGARVLAQMARLAEEEAAAAAVSAAASASASGSDAGSAPPPRLVVMAGSGVTAANAAALAAETGVCELHGSARVPAAAAPAAAGSAAAAAAMAAACAKLGFGAQPPQATEESVRAILDALR